MATKLEEIYSLRLVDIRSLTMDGYSLEQIVDMEKAIMRATQFQINPPTLNRWANLYMIMWDVFSNTNPFGLEILEQDTEGDTPMFKRENIEDYTRFRSVMQVIDLILMDINCYKYDKRELVASAIYLVLGEFFG